MASTFAACVRLTSKHDAVWRECAGCGVLAPHAPDQTRCPQCPTPARGRSSGRN
jgi:hypothetical protein